jgi:hypothetical protein
MLMSILVHVNAYKCIHPQMHISIWSTRMKTGWDVEDIDQRTVGDIGRESSRHWLWQCLSREHLRATGREKWKTLIITLIYCSKLNYANDGAVFCVVFFSNPLRKNTWGETAEERGSEALCRGVKRKRGASRQVHIIEYKNQLVRDQVVWCAMYTWPTSLLLSIAGFCEHIQFYSFR